MTGAITFVYEFFSIRSTSLRQKSLVFRIDRGTHVLYVIGLCFANLELSCHQRFSIDYSGHGKPFYRFTRRGAQFVKMLPDDVEH
jgi:hypothetical protein